MTDSVPGVVGQATSDPCPSLARRLYDEPRAACGDMLRPTADRSRLEVVDDSERSARARLFTVALIMIIDERRSARFRREVAILNAAGTAECAAPDDLNAGLIRL